MLLFDRSVDKSRCGWGFLYIFSWTFDRWRWNFLFSWLAWRGPSPSPSTTSTSTTSFPSTKLLNGRRNIQFGRGNMLLVARAPLVGWETLVSGVVTKRRKFDFLELLNFKFLKFAALDNCPTKLGFWSCSRVKLSAVDQSSATTSCLLLRKSYLPFLQSKLLNFHFLKFTASASQGKMTFDQQMAYHLYPSIIFRDPSAVVEIGSHDRNTVAQFINAGQKILHPQFDVSCFQGRRGFLF